MNEVERIKTALKNSGNVSDTEKAVLTKYLNDQDKVLKILKKSLKEVLAHKSVKVVYKDCNKKKLACVDEEGIMLDNKEIDLLKEWLKNGI